MKYKCISCGNEMLTFWWLEDKNGTHFCPNEACVLYELRMSVDQAKELDRIGRLLESINPDGDLYYNISRLFTPKDGG